MTSTGLFVPAVQAIPGTGAVERGTRTEPAVIGTWQYRSVRLHNTLDNVLVLVLQMCLSLLWLLRLCVLVALHHMPLDWLIDQRAGDRVQRDGCKDRRRFLHPQCLYHVGGKQRADDGAKTSDAELVSGRSASLLFEVRVHRQRGC